MKKLYFVDFVSYHKLPTCVNDSAINASICRIELIFLGVLLCPPFIHINPPKSVRFLLSISKYSFHYIRFRLWLEKTTVLLQIKTATPTFLLPLQPKMRLDSSRGTACLSTVSSALLRSASNATAQSTSSLLLLSLLFPHLYYFEPLNLFFAGSLSLFQGTSGTSATEKFFSPSLP